MKKKLLSVIFASIAALLLTSCSFGKYDPYKDDPYVQELREEVEELSSKLEDLDYKCCDLQFELEDKDNYICYMQDELHDMEKELTRAWSELDLYGGYGQDPISCDICGCRAVSEAMYLGRGDVIYCANCLAEELLSGHNVLDYDG